MLYLKPYLSIEQQLALLKSRGIQVEDDDKAEEYLQRIGYYRLSAYSFPFRVSALDVYGVLQTQDQFKPHTTFKNITDLYAFDKSLRLCALDALERIEISLRTEIALTLGKHDPQAHRNPRYLDRGFTNIPKDKIISPYTIWLSRLDEKAKDSKEEFASHFRKKYFGSHMPIWVAVELLDFGPLSHLLTGMTYSDLTQIAQSYKLPDPVVLKGWIKSLSFVRNVCAHHSRLWNKALVNQPPMPPRGALLDFDHVAISPYGAKRVYVAFCIMRQLLRAVNPRTDWSSRFKDTIKTFPASPHISLKTAGFPIDWEKLPLWN